MSQIRNEPLEVDESTTNKKRRVVQHAASLPLSSATGSWAVKNVRLARLARSQGRAQESAARLAAVVEHLPSLWSELHEELLQDTWEAAGPSLRGHLAEGAAGNLLLGRRAVQSLSGLLRCQGLALAEEGRYCAAFRSLQRAVSVAGRAGDNLARKEALASLKDLKGQALASWHFYMLNDADRNSSFAAAISDALAKLGQHASSAVCLDIGTGTGLLALIARKLSVQHPQIRVVVHACEMNDALCAVAREVLASNMGGSSGRCALEATFDNSSHESNSRSSDIIQLHHTKSTDLQLPNHSVDLVFSETVDAELLGESFIPTALDACERLLRPGGQIIPRRATVFGQLVSCPLILKHFQLATDGGPFSFEGIAIQPETSNISEFLEYLPHDAITEPSELLALDFGQPVQLKAQLAACELPAVTLPAARCAGTVHALAVWWELELDDAGKHRISSKPGRVGNHWPQVLWPVRPQPTGTRNNVIGQTIAAGERWVVCPKLFEERIEYRLQACPQPSCLAAEARLSASLDELTAIPHDDVLWMNDLGLWRKLQKHLAAIRLATPSVIVDASLLALPAAAVLAQRQAAGAAGVDTTSQVSANENVSRSIIASVRGSWKELEVARIFVRKNLQSAAAEAVHLEINRLPHELLELGLEGSEPLASLMLLFANAVDHRGELRPGLLGDVADAHTRCKARSCQLVVLPQALQLELTPIESRELARRSRVLWGCMDGRSFGNKEGGLEDLQLDVRGLNVLSQTNFQGISEERLVPRNLAAPREAMLLPLTSDTFAERLANAEAHSQRLRLGPISVAGRLDGVLCRWSWALENGMCQESKDPGKLAGILWPELGNDAEHTNANDGGITVQPGDFVIVEVCLSATHGVVISPVRISRGDDELTEAEGGEDEEDEEEEAEFEEDEIATEGEDKE